MQFDRCMNKHSNGLTQFATDISTAGMSSSCWESSFGCMWDIVFAPLRSLLRNWKPPYRNRSYQILPLGGVVRTAPLDCRMIDAGFYCPGLPHPGVEAMIAMSDKLLMHHGCRIVLDTFLKTSYSLLLLELGVSFQP